MPDTFDTNYRAALHRATLDAYAGGTLVNLTLKGKLRGPAETDLRQITVRPVVIKGRQHLQFSYLDAKQDTTRNFTGDEAAAMLREALAIPFSSLRLLTTDAETRVQVTKKGKAIVHRGRAPANATPELSHDREKALPIPDTQPDPYLQATGIMNREGAVRPSMRDKFRQVNAFLQLLDHTHTLDGFAERARAGGPPVHLVDFGCGSAYLTLAAYHYLNDLRGIPATLDGVDTNADLIERSSRAAADLTYGGACFYAQPILDYVPQAAPDIVMALHACDTATDDALYQGIRHGAQVILAAPCCHHHLHAQLDDAESPTHALMRPVMRHGIMKKRMADLLTDSFRALILRLSGYKTDVVEFIASEHTDRNLMIRAVKREAMPEAGFAREYADLKAAWGVTPYLETLLGDALPVP